MKICLLANDPATSPTTDADDPAAAAAALADAGHEIVLLTAAETTRKQDEPFRFESRRWGRDGDEAFEPEVVHVLDPFLSGEHALRLAESSGAPLVFSAGRRYSPPIPLSEPEERALRRFLETLGACFATHCDLIVANTPAIADQLRARGVLRPIRVVPEADAASGLAAHASRLAEVYAAARGLVGRARRATPPDLALHNELAAAWLRARPSRPGPSGARWRSRAADRKSPCGRD